MRLYRRADLAHDLGVDADQIVAAHARLARHAGGGGSKDLDAVRAFVAAAKATPA
jgi:hypothetical protein